MKNKTIVNEKRIVLDADDNNSDSRNELRSHNSTQQPFSSETHSKSSKPNLKLSSSNHVVFARSRSKSSVSYAETSKQAIKSPNHNDGVSISAVKHFNNQTVSTNLSSSLINAFQMPQNFAQAFPNINMSSLPDYLPSVSMPAMPNISMPKITMPSMPTLSMPSMPNLSMPNISMPSIPSISNINIPSISDLMSNYELSSQC